MNGSFDAKICHTDVKFHGVVQNNVKRNLSKEIRTAPGVFSLCKETTQRDSSQLTQRFLRVGGLNISTGLRSVSSAGI